MLATISAASFYAIAAGILVVSVLAVTARNLFHAAIFLAFTLLGVAIVYFFLHAEFIAAIQILIYVGAVLTLIIFAIMLTSRMGDPGTRPSNRQQYWAALPLLGIFVLGVPILWKADWPVSTSGAEINLSEIGKLLMTQYVLPFELISVVLLVGLVGAIVVAKNDERGGQNQ